MIGISSKPRTLSKYVQCIPRTLPLEPFHHSWKLLSQSQQDAAYRSAHNKAQRILNKQRAKTGTAILGSPLKQVLEDPKYQGEVKSKSIVSGEITALKSLAAELVVLTVAQIPSKEHKLYTGRGQYPKFVKQPVVKQTQHNKDLCPHILFWGHVKGFSRFILRAAIDLKLAHCKDLITNLIELLTSSTHHVEPLSQAQQAEVIALHRSLSFADLHIWQQFHTVIEDVFKTCVSTKINSIRSDWHRFVKSQLSIGGGKLFKYISTWDRRHLSIDWDQGKSVNSSDFLDNKVAKWSQFWCPEDAQSEHLQLVQELNDFREYASSFTASKFTVADFDKSLKGYRKDTLGIDVWSATELRGLPLPARSGLAESIDCTLSVLALPHQSLISLNALLGKPNLDDRTICKTPMLYRTLTRADKEVREWEASNAQAYDSAKAGSSALLAALARNLNAEIASWLGYHVASIFNDYHKFFDTLRIITLLVEATMLSFPPRCLVLALMQHLAPRVLQVNGASSTPINIIHSILAGCKFSVALTRVYLMRDMMLLDKNHKEANTKLFVDDTSMQATGDSIDSVCDILVPAVVDFARKVKKLRLSLSPKAVISANSKKLSNILHQELSNYQLTFVKSRAARDLGVDHTSAKRRPSSLLILRDNKSKVRRSHICKLAKISRKARRLFSGSAFAMSTWGHQASAIADTSILNLERDALGSTGIPAPGRCRALALVCAFGVLGTPRARIIRETMSAWFKLVLDLNSVELYNLRCAWGKAKLAIRGNTCVSQVLGLMSNVIYILVKAGWEPFAYNLWTDDEGATWTMTSRLFSPNIVSAALAKSYLALDLRRAETHYNGQGIKNGIDFEATLIVLRSLGNKRDHDYQLKCALESVISAAVWPAARVHMINPSFSSCCPRCSAVAETCLHTYWECPGNGNIDHQYVIDTQYLCNRAIANAVALPCLWLRGILPDHFTQVEKAHEPSIMLSITIVSPENVIWNSGTYYGDASGGIHTQYPKLRRVGVGLARINPDNTLSFAIHSNLPGAVQTVGRGETFSLVLLMREIVVGAQVDFVTDNENVSKTFNAGHSHSLSSCNCDLFDEIFKLMVSKSIRLNVRWMPSHVADPSLLPLGVSISDWEGNKFADKYAGVAAAAVQLPPAITIGPIHYINLVKKVQRRLAIIIISLPNRKSDRVPSVKVPKESLESLISASSHDVRRSAHRVNCIACLSSFAIIDSSLRPWLSAPCPISSHKVLNMSHPTLPGNQLSFTGTSAKRMRFKGPNPSFKPLPFQLQSSSSSASVNVSLSRPEACPVDSLPHIGNSNIHSSHKMLVHRGLKYCNKCGSVATNLQIRKLARQCEPPKPKSHGINIIRSIRRDCLPKSLSMTVWPDGSSS